MGRRERGHRDWDERREQARRGQGTRFDLDLLAATRDERRDRSIGPSPASRSARMGATLNGRRTVVPRGRLGSTGRLAEDGTTCPVTAHETAD